MQETCSHCGHTHHTCPECHSKNFTRHENDTDDRAPLATDLLSWIRSHEPGDSLTLWDFCWSCGYKKEYTIELTETSIDQLD